MSDTLIIFYSLIGLYLLVGVIFTAALSKENGFTFLENILTVLIWGIAAIMHIRTFLRDFKNMWFPKCAWCGELQDHTAGKSKAEKEAAMKAHILVCDKHPMRIEIENALNLAERDGLLAIRYYEQLKEIKRLLAAKPDTEAAKDYILGEISDVVGGEG
jgi:hypothetical protein